MALLIIGGVIFFGVHSISIVAPAFRSGAIQRLGEGAWKGLSGLASLVALGLMIYGFGLARGASAVLYAPPSWMRYAAVLLMLPVFPLLIGAYLPGRIKAATRHPMLAAVKFWAFAHLLANGRLADVLLFGGFLAWAVADRISLKRRPPQRVPAAPATRFNDLWAVVLGLALYAITIGWLHVRLFGVSPLG